MFVKFSFYYICLMSIGLMKAQTNPSSPTKVNTGSISPKTTIQDIATPPTVPSIEPVRIDPANAQLEDAKTPTTLPSPVELVTQVPIENSAEPRVFPTEDIVVEKPNGNINWSQQYIEAKGQSAIDYDRFKNKAQARLMATRGAIVIAQRNLLEIVKGVEIVGETKVEDMITTNDYVYSRVEGVVKGAKQIGIAIERDEVIEVTVRMPIYSNKGIASVFGDKEIQKAHLRNGYKSSFMPQDETISGNLDPNKPLVFSLNGKKIDLSLFPVIVDDNNNVQFDFSKLLNTRTGEFPKYLQLTKDIMKDIGYDKGVNVIELIQSGKGEFKLPKKTNGAFWRTLGNVAKTTGKILFNIPFK
jgi:hypothetical protein